MRGGGEYNSAFVIVQLLCCLHVDFNNYLITEWPFSLLSVERLIVLLEAAYVAGMLL